MNEVGFFPSKDLKLGKQANSYSTVCKSRVDSQVSGFGVVKVQIVLKIIISSS